METDGIIFDLDGTLWDSCRVVSESWGITLRERFGAGPGPTPREVRGIMGMTAAQIAEALFSRYGARAEEVCLACIHGENAYIARHGGDLYPGVGEALAELAGRLPLFIVSNCLEGYIECFLESSGFAPLFRDHLCEGETGLPKAGNIARIMERHGLRRPVYVGDTAMDEKSARAAGCAFVHAAYGFGTAEHPDAVIAAPLELVPLLRASKGGAAHA